MMWVWIGDASGEGQGYRVLATSQKGTFPLPPTWPRLIRR